MFTALIFLFEIGVIMKKTAVIVLLNLILALSVFAQTGEESLKLETGVRMHQGIDEIYRQFSDSYRTLNVEKVTNLYTEHAAYLAPERDITQGRAAIRENFRSFFERVKTDGRNMTISFQILQRQVDKNMAYDVGVYTIRSYKDGKQIGTGQGKFVVVAVKEKDGKWRFQVDGYSGLKPPEKK